MGLFYNAFINETIKAFKEQSCPFEEFLQTQKMKDIMTKYDILEGSLNWALNVDKIFEDLKIEPVIYKERISKLLQDNANDWINSDMSYLDKYKD
jgi:hypothetical protein